MPWKIRDSEDKPLSQEQIQAVRMITDLIPPDLEGSEMLVIIERNPDGSAFLEIKGVSAATKDQIIKSLKGICWKDLRFEELPDQKKD